MDSVPESPRNQLNSIGTGLAPQGDSSSDEDSVEECVPAAYRLVPHTSYHQIKKHLDSLLVSKRATRDSENIDHFIRADRKSGCARVDAVYTVHKGARNHIKVQNKDEYWAELEHQFPYLQEEPDSS